jgi:signal transduction histidine kinase
MGMKEVFFRRVEHDLRGELATMMAGLHYVLRYEKGVEGAAREMLERVQGAGERLRRLLDEFGDAACIDGIDSNELVLEPYDLDAMLREIIERLSASAAARGVTVSFVPPTDGGTFVGDGDLLRSALEYLVDFAIARARDQTVTVSWEAVNRCPVVTVVDQGGAVSDEQLAHLFEPFAEQEVVSKPLPGTRKRERLGLGLAIARSVVAAHRGSITVGHGIGRTGLLLRCVLSEPADRLKQSA